MSKPIPNGKMFLFQPTGESAGGTNLGVAVVTASIDDATFGYVAQAGPGIVAVVPRANIPLGGTKTVTVTCHGKTKDTGVDLPALVLTFDMAGAPIPPQATLLISENEALADIAGAPADLGTPTVAIS